MKVLVYSLCLAVAGFSVVEARCKAVTTTSKVATTNNVFCFWEAQNTGPNNGIANATDLPYDVCTHILYSYIGDTDTINDLVALKKKNSNLKLIFSIAHGEGGLDLSVIVEDSDTQKSFISNLVTYIKESGFDGVNLGWGVTETTSTKYITLLKDLQTALSAKGYYLSVAVGVTPDLVKQYDISSINKYVDNIVLMAFDYHMYPTDTVTGVNAPLYPQLTDTNKNLNVNASVHLFLDGGATASKLVLGVATYATSFTLENHKVYGTGAKATAAGAAGKYTKEQGFFAYYEICYSQKTATWAIKEVAGNYVYGNTGRLWAGYDNANTIYAKGAYAKSLGLGGVSIWNLDYDDYSGLCSTTKFPLTKSARNGYLGL